MCFGMQKPQGTQDKVAEQSLYSTLGCRNWNLSLEPDLNASTCRQDPPAPNFNVAISNCPWQSCSEHRTRSTNTLPNNVEIGGSGVASTAKAGKTAWMASSNSVWHKRLPLRASSGWFWGGMTWNGCGHATAHGTTTRKLRARKTSLQSITQRWRKKTTHSGTLKPGSANKSQLPKNSTQKNKSRSQGNLLQPCIVSVSGWHAIMYFPSSSQFEHCCKSWIELGEAEALTTGDHLAAKQNHWDRNSFLQRLHSFLKKTSQVTSMKQLRLLSSTNPQAGQQTCYLILKPAFKLQKNGV